MTEIERKALEQIGVITDAAALRRMIINSRGKSELVEKAAFRRLVAVSAKHQAGSLEHDCWSMIHTIEELRRASGRKVSRMNRLRPKIAREGELAAIAYCALNETDGFAEVIAYGMPELTAEAIVLRHRERFDQATISAASARLEAAGVQLGDDS